MTDLPSREAVKASLATVDTASTMGVDPIVRYPTLRGILDSYVSGRLVDRETIDPAEFAKVLIDNAGAIAAAVLMNVDTDD